MRVLQLTGDWKWTGPAEPMLRLARALGERGHAVWTALPEAPEPGRRSVASEARAAGLAPAHTLRVGRGVRPLADRDEVRALRALLERRDVEVVHAWHTRDHVLALRAAARRRREGRTAVVRSYRAAEPLPRTPWHRWLFGRGTDGLLCVSPRTAERNAGLRGGRPVRGALGAVDLERFAPAPPSPAVRDELGLGADDRVVGIVARVQPHRRFDLLLEAARRLAGRLPGFRLLVVGRGTRRAELLDEPVARLGLEGVVSAAGYRTADYADCLRALDVFTYLVPGSDGTCRALLEAQACGIPAVTTRRGALPEIVEEGGTGLLVEEEAEALAGAWEALLGDPERRRRMGARARDRAEKCFAPARLAEAAEALYADALRHRRG